MDNFDDENYNDGFDDDALAASMNVELWKKLFGYAKQYPRDLTYLGGFAFVVASAEVTYPLITKGVVDAVAADGADAVLLPWALGYLLCTVAITLSIGGFIWMGGKIRTHVSHDIRRDGFANLQRLSFSFYD